MLKTKSLDARRFQLMAAEHVLRRGKRAKKRREELQLTQEDVAERIQELHAERFPDKASDKTRGQMISDYERGINDPRGERLELWAAALGWMTADLEADSPQKKNGDLMDGLSEAQEGAELPQQVADALDAHRAEVGEKLDALHGELEAMKRLLTSSRRKRKGTGS
jgi:transcriptional regulator with XRE-family HTH domain